MATSLPKPGPHAAEADRLDRRQLAVGILACSFFALHAGVQIDAGKPHNLIWACHAAALLVGLGALWRVPLLTAAGTLLLTVGIPSWLINLAAGGAFYPTSIFTHVGGWTCGIISLRWEQKFPRHASAAALIAVASLMLAARLVTPAAPNVNLAHAPWRALPASADCWEVHIAMVLLIWAVLLYIAERIVRRICVKPGLQHAASTSR